MKKTELEVLAERANDALFDLHLHIGNGAVEGDERWRQIYKARCDVNALTAHLIKEAEESHDGK